MSLGVVFKRLSLFAFISCTITALILTLLPADQLSQTNLLAYDKLGHFLLFYVWTYLFGLTAMFWNWNRFTHLTVVLIASILFGLAIEIMQRIFPINRAFEWADLAADAAGSILAIISLYYMRKKYRFNRKKLT